MRQLSYLLIIVIAISATVLAGVPQVINYQGQLTDPSGDPVNATVQITFSICVDSLGSTCSWTEVHPGVVVTGGLFDVLLGSITPFTGVDFATDQRWLGISVGGESLPYTRLVSVPWALIAGGVAGFTPGPDNIDEGLYSLIGGDSNTVLSDYSVIAGGYGNMADAQVDADTIPDTSDIFNPPGGGGFSPPSPTTTGWGAFIGGGIGNHAHGGVTVVGGGWGNTSWCAYSATVGGFRNLAAGHFSFLGGGFRNAISSDSTCWCGYASVLGGGYMNVNDGVYSTLGGGIQNRIQSCIAGATIGGGLRNTVMRQAGTVAGGWGNIANGDAATVGGGEFNYANARLATISGGGRADATNTASNNEVWDEYGSIGGGGDNKAGSNDGIEINAVYTTIAGGGGNRAAADYASIGGGGRNTVLDTYGAIGGGQNNNVTAPYATIGGGSSNLAEGQYSTIAGGENNIIQSHDHQFIGGGRFNFAPDPYGTISGGLDNQALTWATVGGGTGNFAHNEYTFIGGGLQNLANGHAAVIVGGLNNQSTEWATSVGGGENNLASFAHATVGGGLANEAKADFATIGGGGLVDATNPTSNNEVWDQWGTIGGGGNNKAGSNDADGNNAIFATVAGGGGNLASANYATVPGGFENEATAINCFAAGIRAKSVDSCSFVWADCCDLASGLSIPFYSSGPRTWNARATGGFNLLTSCDSVFDPAAGIGTGVYLPAGGSQWLAGSDRNKKRELGLVNGKTMLDKISKLPIYRWSYKAQDASIQHIGPMAQDFYATFGIGDNDKTIASLDPSGVALAAIKELYRANKQLQAKTNEIDELRAELAEIRGLIDQVLAQQRAVSDPSKELAAKP